jgi:hypothetical protein
MWQRNYWEHIIRSGKALDRIRQYIEDNPAALLPWMHVRSRPLPRFAPLPAGGPEPQGF